MRKTFDVTDLLSDQEHPKEPQRTVVRLRTTLWEDRKGFHLKKDLTFLNRQCFGHNILADDLENGGACDVYPRILDISTAEDGVYEVVTHPRYQLEQAMLFSSRESQRKFLEKLDVEA